MIKNVEAGKRLDINIDIRDAISLYPQNVIATLNEMFLQWAAFKENDFYCIVQYIGARNAASKYRYKVSVSREEENGQISEDSASRVVFSETDELEDICGTRQCVVLSCDLLEKYYFDNKGASALKYFVEITGPEDTDA
jgi:hypothetical protein